MTFDLDSVRGRLSGRSIEWHDAIDSTMHRAAELARQGAAGGTIVGAEQQTAGIGRLGRTWLSTAGEGLYVSIVLRLPIVPDQLPVVMLALGLATREAIAGTTGLACDLRWPNDVLVNERKCAGVLAQLDEPASSKTSAVPKQKARSIVAGIGINVLQSTFPAGLDTPATSLAMEGAAATREDLLVALAEAVDSHCGLLAEAGPEPILRAFCAGSSYASGRRVRVSVDGRDIVGVTSGLDASGFLRVREDNGAETTILSGGVRAV